MESREEKKWRVTSGEWRELKRKRISGHQTQRRKKKRNGSEQVAEKVLKFFEICRDA